MAQRTARFLVEHPESRLVVLAGTGHVIRSGIPARVTRRAPADAVSVVLQGGSHDSPSVHEEDGDFMLVSKMLELPPAGMLGVMLDTEAGRVSVQSFADGSAAEQAGLASGDRIVELQGRPVSDFAGIKMGLLGKHPGDTVSVKVERKTGDGSVETLPFDVTLR
jgi:S1-C subfamily serine protease